MMSWHFPTNLQLCLVFSVIVAKVAHGYVLPPRQSLKWSLPTSTVVVAAENNWHEIDDVDNIGSLKSEIIRLKNLSAKNVYELGSLKDEIEKMRDGQSGAQASNSIMSNEDMVAVLRNLKDELMQINKDYASETVIELQSLKGEILVMEETQSKIHKKVTYMENMQNLAWAIDNANLGSFPYFHYAGGDDSTTRAHHLSDTEANSGDLVRDILLNFRRGHIWYLPDNMSMERNDDYSGSEIDSYATHNLLLLQIHRLTGSEPSIEWDVDNAKYYIRENL